MEPFGRNSGTLFLPLVKAFSLASPPEFHFLYPTKFLFSKIPLTQPVAILGKS